MGIVTGEEAMEMAGIISYIHALLQYIGEYYPDVGLCFPREARISHSHSN